ncbi:unnamed protein product [Cylicocyclus nassatus]|uniref:Carboxylesterase type B domain-containing protein n=1 Tax=Cylicocyclus nassatus TaxID=53992 RepID=A0AA36DM98_CYLNA|nr:unnamed protein product [Cylicocyclus nassatus]
MFSTWLLLPTLFIPLSLAQVLKLTPGKILGFDYKTKDGAQAEVYLGIPYARAPVGELRFERPKPPEPWNDIRDCRDFAPICYPIVLEAVAAGEEASEDCLMLNIIRPKKEAPEGGFPILFWVHGGAYEMGSAVECGYQGFADIYVPNDIIVVTIQYRLSIYGFFSTGDDRIKGNMGLYDMAEALKFVHDNAANIGGDPSRITVWGHSAGSASVSLLILSPVTRGYVRRSIEMSGSPWASWALGPKVADNSLALAKELGCQEDVKKCMQQKSAEEIYDGIKKVGLRFIKWGAVIDGEFVQEPEVMVADAPPKMSIVGSTNKEAALFSLLGTKPFRYFHSLYVAPEDYKNWSKQRLIKKLKRLVEKEYIGGHLDELMDEIIRFYVDRGEEENNEIYLDRYTEFLSDVFFNVPVANGVLARRAAGWDIYAYYLDHYNDAIWDGKVPKKLRGAPHFAEFPYVNGVGRLAKYDFTKKEQVVADVFRQSFASFVKNGAPTNNHEVWLDIGTEDFLRYLRVTPDPEMRDGFHNDSLTFWHATRRFGFDVTNLQPVKKDEETKETKQEL